MCDLPGVVKSTITESLVQENSNNFVINMELYYALMFQDHPQKLSVYTYTRLLKQYPRVYASFDLKPMYIKMCAK